MSRRCGNCRYLDTTKGSRHQGFACSARVPSLRELIPHSVLVTLDRLPVRPEEGEMCPLWILKEVKT